MKTIKPSTVVQRQIPQHVRENYPLFVEFLKCYYKFLDNSQQTLIDEITEIEDARIDEFNNPISLEKIRDIDTSLDVFINQFKKEFAENVPINKASDPRQLIKHMREFYLSRGSESSYKFLFKTLFDKDVELFYPSAQILRVSDGRWQQDVSVFVRSPNDMDIDLSPLNGNFVTISTTREVSGRAITKKLTTFVNRVVKYSSGIYELYIQRDYINEIDVGSIVSFEGDGIVYLAAVLPCPSKLSIFKKGKGFKVGQLFSLQTQIGRGCLVKVTKVGPLGEIENIKLVEVGLDYLTTFFSYLSNKDVPPVEYVHPAKLNQPYVPGTPAYNELLGGFTDHGFASKQNYFDYDTNIPVATPDKASDRFFADPSYVGDLDAQFYADDTKNPIDEDLAIIKIELGAVAKYPGFYMTQDGFISDEIYIQDGNYYQAFSYVIKVDEELRRYSDIVKKILHPAGMKMFSEYTITTEITFKSAIEALKKVIDKIDGVNVLDQGFNFSAYVRDLNNPNIVYRPAPGASKVFSGFGKPALFVSKELADATEHLSLQAKSVNKPITGDYASTADDKVVKHFYKILSHMVGVSEGGFAYDNYITTIVNGAASITPAPNANIVYSSGIPSKAVSKKLIDLVSYIETLSKSVNKPFNENITILDYISKLYDKNLVESLSLTDEQYKLVNKSLSEVVTYSESIDKSAVKTLTDVILLAEYTSKTYEKYLTDGITQSDNAVKTISKALNEIITILDILESKEVTKNHSDFINTLSVINKSLEKSLQDLLTITDESYKEFRKNLSEEIISQDYIEKLFDKYNEDSVQLLDGINKEFRKNLVETLVVLDYISKSVTKSQDDFVTVIDYAEILRTLLYEDMVFVFDENTKTVSKNNLVEQIVIADYSDKAVQGNKRDSINIMSSGYVVLNPYDAEYYSAPEEQYTANTPIT